MSKEGAFIVDVGITNLPFPIRAFSRVYPEGQPTVANITVHARIMREFETRWIDRLGSINIKAILEEVTRETKANALEVRFNYPFFVE